MALSWKQPDVVAAIIAGVLYGVVAQFAIRLDFMSELYGVMSFGYVFVLPLVLGFFSAWVAGPGVSLATAVLCGIATTLGCLVVSLLVGWEGTICVVMAAPVYIPLAIFGSIVGYAARRSFDGSGRSRYAVGLMLILPLASVFVEAGLPTGPQVREVHNAIDIQAPPEIVWSRIERVAPIHEEQESFFFTMGFPRPVEATLSHPGVGGVREASFERGLLFVETVTEWDPPRSLRFEIAVDPSHTPLTTLDAHVTVGGRYFDVLEGGYAIESLGQQGVRLHLTSSHRISTHFNFYTALWSEFLMSEIQRNILRVLKARCELAAGAA